MKLIFIFSFVLSLQVFARTTAQTKLFSFEMQDKTIEEVIEHIENESDYCFFYKSDEEALKKNVNVSYIDKDVLQILDNLFEDTKLSYKVVDKYIAVSEHLGEGQQTNRIVGKVRDDLGEPIPGVNVIIKGTSKGTITDINGDYVISNVPENGILQFSSVGLAVHEIVVGGQTTVNIKMTSDVIGLDEVVVVGYGTIKKREVVGSVASISSENLERLNVASIDQAMQGMGAGFQVVDGATAGAQSSVKVRGINSVSLSIEPLWVLDGVIVNKTQIGLINPVDVKSIEVLKDAGATAIYGSRASSGVILVTTKDAVKGGSFSVSYKAGVSKMFYNDILVNNPEDYFTTMDLMLSNDTKGSMTKYDPDLQIISKIASNTETLSRAQAELENNRWIELLSRIGNKQDLNISASKKNDNGSYYGSINYYNESGTRIGNDFSRISGSVKLTHKFLEHINFGLDANLGYSKKYNNAGFNPATPFWVKPYSDDSLSAIGYWNPYSGINPLVKTDRKYWHDRESNFTGIGMAFLDIEMPWVKGLNIRVDYSLSYGSNYRDNYSSQLIDWEELGSGNAQGIESFSRQFSAYATYKRILNSFSLNLVAGYEQNSGENSRLYVQGNKLTTSYDYLGRPDVLVDGLFTLGGETRYASYFSRGNFVYKDKYILGISFRRDGTYQFHPTNRWSNFSALSAGWILSDEPFFQTPWVSLLKIRGSYGQTGNSNVGGSIRYSTYAFRGSSYGAIQYASAYTLNRVGNNDIKWEVTDSYDVGLDYGLWKNRVNGYVNIFRQNVSDMILQAPLPPSTGVNNAQIPMNVGEMYNKGFEFDINTTNIKRKKFVWKTNLNYTWNENQIRSLEPSIDASGTGIEILGSRGSGNTITKKGQSIKTFFVATYTGVEEEKGIPMIKEIDKDHYITTGETVYTGNIIPATTTNTNDNLYIQKGKSELPKWFGGIMNSFTYKSFDCSFLITYTGGHYKYNLAGLLPGNGELFNKNLITDSWRSPGDKAKYPALSLGHVYPYGNDGEFLSDGSFATYEGASTYYLHRADFARLKNLQIGYNLPSNNKMLKNVKIRIHFTATNLLTLTKYPSWDPENSFMARTYMMGVNINL